MSFFSSLGSYLAYIATMAGLLTAATAAYTAITPYREFTLIREGNSAAAASLIGTVVGLALPLASLAAHAVGFGQMLAWSLVALLCQLALYAALSCVLPGLKDGIQKGSVAHGLTLGGLSLAVGLLNAGAVT